MIRLLNKMDKPLLFLTLFMFIFGLFMIFDASSMISFITFGSNTKFFSKQLTILIISFIFSIFLLFIKTKDYKRYIYPVVLITIFLLVFLLMFGEETNGAKSWIYIFGFGLQPSEIAKLVIIVFLSFFYKYNIRRLDNWFYSIFPLGIGAIFTLLTFLQPDGGTGLILFLIVVMLFFASPVSRKIKFQITLIGLSIIATVVLVCVIAKYNPLNGMQQSRFNYTKPCTRYQESTGYQVCNGYIAINNGKLFSIDIGNSKQKYLYLPEAYTDFIFPIIVEEMGLITGIVVILIYFIIIVRILVIGKKSEDIMNSLICYGIASYIFLHVVINLVGVLGILPLTGVPLPFLSYGGSFALSLLLALTVVQRISIENYEFKKQKVFK